jgi:hypothetical protein
MTQDEAFTVLRANVLLVRDDVPATEVRPERTLASLDLSSLDRLDVLVGALDDVGLPPKVDVLTGARTLGELAAALAEAA